MRFPNFNQVLAIQKIHACATKYLKKSISNGKYFIFLILLIAIFSIAERIYNAGLIGGLDYFLFQPDGAYYSIKSYQLLGHGYLESLDIVKNFYLVHAKSIEYFSFGGNFQNNLMATRVLYPLLSVPFVAIFGMWGMLVVPCVSFIFIFIHISRFALKNRLSGVSILIPILLLSFSPTFTRWMIVNYTEALNVFLFYLIFHFLGVNQKFTLVRDLTIISLFSAVALNHSEPFLTFAFALWAIRKKIFKNNRIVLSAILIVNILPFLFYKTWPLGFEKSPSNSLDFFYKVFEIPLIEVAQLVILDKPLLILILLGFYSLRIKAPRYSSLSLLPYFFVAALVQSIVIGAPGTNFRYFIITIPLLVYGTMDIINESV